MSGLGERVPTRAEAAFLASIAVRGALPAGTSSACMNELWVESLVGIHWRLTETGSAALERHREVHGNG